MVILQAKPKQSASGARYKSGSKKRKYQIGGLPINTLLSEKEVIRTKRCKGGIVKQKLAYTKTINLLNKKTKKYEKVTIKAVVENAANRHFVRRNIITKGTIVDTEKGKARITSSPGQNGTLNAILVE